MSQDTKEPGRQLAARPAVEATDDRTVETSPLKQAALTLIDPREGRGPSLPAIVSPEADPDHALVLRAQGGDQAAFAELFDRHHGRVYAMCCRMLRDPMEVEDAVQHAFLEAWRCLHRFEGRSRFSTWITRIAIHTCFGVRRRLKRWLFSDDLPEQVKDAHVQGGAPRPDEGAELGARQRAIDAILRQLSEKKRVVFVLSELEGLTAPEIAEIVECPEATVRTRLFHARRDFVAIARQHQAYRELFGLADSEPA